MSGHPPTDLTGFQRDALSVIAQATEPHGLAIKEQLEGVYEQPVNHGRLYPNLDDLVEKGLVQKGTKDRRTNSYDITKRGERVLADYREFIGSGLVDE